MSEPNIIGNTLNCKTGSGKLPRTGLFLSIKGWQLKGLIQVNSPHPLRPPRGASDANRKGNKTIPNPQFSETEVQLLYYLVQNYSHSSFCIDQQDDLLVVELARKLLDYSDYS
mgnify:CR=1 FL=1